MDDNGVNQVLRRTFYHRLGVAGKTVAYLVDIYCGQKTLEAEKENGTAT